MKEHFKEQLRTATPMTEAQVKSHHDRRMAQLLPPCDYLDDDRMLYMIEMFPDTKNNNRLTMNVLTLTDRELDGLSKTHIFERMSAHMPVFIRKD